MEISGYFEMLFTGLEKYEDIICILKAYGKSVVNTSLVDILSSTVFHGISLVKGMGT